jgi:hypothetical protein
VCNVNAGCPTLYNILNNYTSWGASLKAISGMNIWDSSNLSGCCNWYSVVRCDSTKLGKKIYLSIISNQLKVKKKLKKCEISYIACKILISFRTLNGKSLKGTIPTQLGSLTALNNL